MEIKFFGHYLLDKSILTSQQLVEAVEHQTSNNLSLGELAVKQNLISEKEANKINDMQRSQDQRFGEVAVSLNLLSELQIDALIAIQKENKVFFGEVLILKGFISKENLEKELSIFNQEQNIEVKKIDSKITSMDKQFIVKHSIDVLEVLYSRIIHDNIKLVNISQTASPSSDNGTIAMQKMRGDENINFALQVQDQVAINITKKYLKMDYDTMDEMVVDVIAEFVNVILGNIAVKLSSDNIVVDLTPPEIIDASAIDTSYYAFDFTTTQGKLSLYLKV